MLRIDLAHIFGDRYLVQPILRIPNICLFTFWYLFPDKSFKLISKYIHPKMPIYLVILKRKTLCNTLNWGNWNSGLVKLRVRWGQIREKIAFSVRPISKFFQKLFNNRNMYQKTLENEQKWTKRRGHWQYLETKIKV